VQGFIGRFDKTIAQKNEKVIVT